MKSLRLNGDWHHVHFVGLGGAGMRGLAEVLHDSGLHVSGCDVRESKTTARLSRMGVRVDIGHDEAHLDGVDAVIYSSAISGRCPELVAAATLGIPLLRRAELLSLLSAGKRSIVVAGTHGKTTTTAMLARVLVTAGLDPTYIIGADLIGASGAHLGGGDFFVAESDESDGSFLLMKPEVAVVTNVEADHLDHWGNIENLREGFRHFLRNIEVAGTAVVCVDDPMLSTIDLKTATIGYGLGTGATVSASQLDLAATGSQFVLEVRGEATGEVFLQCPGIHNVYNALGAAGAALCVGVDPSLIVKGLGAFKGVARRFEHKGRVHGADVVDDYAHHPTEIAATLQAARAGPWKRIVAVFQPHRFSRTQALSREFGPALAHADLAVITDIYSAGEDPVPGVTGKVVVDAVWDARPKMPIAYFEQLDEVRAYLLSVAREGDAIVCMGAGDIAGLPERLRL